MRGRSPPREELPHLAHPVPRVLQRGRIVVEVDSAHRRLRHSGSVERDVQLPRDADGTQDRLERGQEVPVPREVPHHPLPPAGFAPREFAFQVLRPLPLDGVDDLVVGVVHESVSPAPVVHEHAVLHAFEDELDAADDLVADADVLRAEQRVPEARGAGVHEKAVEARGARHAAADAIEQRHLAAFGDAVEIVAAADVEEPVVEEADDVAVRQVRPAQGQMAGNRPFVAGAELHADRAVVPVVAVDHASHHPLQRFRGCWTVVHLRSARQRCFPRAPPTRARHRGRPCRLASCLPSAAARAPVAVGLATFAAGSVSDRSPGLRRVGRPCPLPGPQRRSACSPERLTSLQAGVQTVELVVSFAVAGRPPSPVGQRPGARTAPGRVSSVRPPRPPLLTGARMPSGTSHRVCFRTSWIVNTFRQAGVYLRPRARAGCRGELPVASHGLQGVREAATGRRIPRFRPSSASPRGRVHT